MNLYIFLAGRNARAAFAFCFLLSAILARADTNTAPAISTQPANGIAGIGEDFSFSVAATGTPPLSYQWFFAGNALTGQTNSVLLLTNLTAGSAGTFSVNVANAAGTLASSNAVLTIVLTNTAHRLQTGRVIQVGSSVAVPIILRSNGRENAVSFSFSYNVSAYSNPRFLSRNNFTLDLSQTGMVGVAFALAPGTALAAGYQWLGLMEFDLTNGHGLLEGGLAFTTNPVPIAAVSPLGTTLMVSAAVQPQYATSTTNPTLNLQSGLFEHRLIVSNPGATPMTNINILALNLGIETVSNAITFYNSQSTLAAFPYGDPLIDVVCDCGFSFHFDVPLIPIPSLPGTNSYANYVATQLEGYLSCGNGQCALDLTGTNSPLPFAQLTNLLAGESRTVTIEFNVRDHFTIPTPKYSLYQSDPLILSVPQTATVLSIDATRFYNGAFLVEFTTRLGTRYFVQYASTPEGLANPQTVFPPVVGTGARVQWLDNGPPKTDSPPVNGARFYRVVQSQ